MMIIIKIKIIVILKNEKNNNIENDEGRNIITNLSSKYSP